LALNLQVLSHHRWLFVHGRFPRNSPVRLPFVLLYIISRDAFNTNG
jgi:hypothetical protein